MSRYIDVENISLSKFHPKQIEINPNEESVISYQLGWNDAIDSIIEFEPTVDIPQWIPCSERLPEENGRYLVTNSAWGAMKVDWNAWMDGAWLYPNTKPIAWMPLPEPWKGEAE